MYTAWRRKKLNVPTRLLLLKVSKVQFPPRQGESVFCSESPYGSSPLRVGNTFWVPQRIPKTLNGTELCIYCVFFYIHTFSLSALQLLFSKSELPASRLWHSRPSACKAQVTEHNSHCDTTAVSLVTGQQHRARARTHWTKGWLTSRAGWRGMARNFITRLRTAHNLKLMNCLFLEFSIWYFWTTGNWSHGKKKCRWGGGREGGSCALLNGEARKSFFFFKPKSKINIFKCPECY